MYSYMASVLTASLKRSMSRAERREGLNVKLKIQLKSIHCMQNGDPSYTTMIGGCHPSVFLVWGFFRTHWEIFLYFTHYHKINGRAKLYNSIKIEHHCDESECYCCVIFGVYSYPVFTARLAKRAKVMFSLCMSVHRGGVPRSNIFFGGGGRGGPKVQYFSWGGGAGGGPPPPKKKLTIFFFFPRKNFETFFLNFFFFFFFFFWKKNFFFFAWKKKFFFFGKMATQKMATQKMATQSRGARAVRLLRSRRRTVLLGHDFECDSKRRGIFMISHNQSECFLLSQIVVRSCLRRAAFGTIW